jgi:hypothetical protein
VGSLFDRGEARRPLPERAIVLSHVIDAAGYSERLRAAVAGSNLRRQCSKKRGGGIAPAAIAALIEGGCCSVNGLERGGRLKSAL